MAPHTLQPFDAEFHRSDISKPQPLRIIKRSKTISGSSSSGEILCRGRGASGISEQSQGSPPMEKDRPLTVAKRRKGRGTVLDDRFNSHGEVKSKEVGATENVLKKKSQNVLNQVEDPETTPKAHRPVPRTMSAGEFLKAEFHGGKQNENSGIYSVRGTRETCSSDYYDYTDHFLDSKSQYPYPKYPERRLSKSKNFLLRAIGGRASERSKHIRQTDQATRSNLIRKLSQSKGGVHTRSDPGNVEHSSSADSSESFELEGRDITEASFHSGASSSGQALSTSSIFDTRPPLHNYEALVLSPLVTIVPEVSSVNVSNCTFWVAIEIKGILRSTNDQTKDREDAFLSPDGPMNSHLSGHSAYGYLYSMKIEILPMQDCYITDLIGDIHETDSIRAGQTRLLLARVDLGKSNSSCSVKPSPSDALMADLETSLGNTLAPYLTVRLSYKHSAFIDSDAIQSTANIGSSHKTHLQTDVLGVIGRHNSQSAWSPRNSQALNTVPSNNPLLAIIEKHFPPSEVAYFQRRVSEDRDPVGLKRHFFGPKGSSEETVKTIVGNASVRMDSAIYTPLDIDGTASPGVSSAQEPTGPFARLPRLAHYREPDEDIDPARKIWNEMRQSSRGGTYSQLWETFSSTDDYYNMDEDLTPTRKSSSAATSSTMNSEQSTGSIIRSKSHRIGLNEERNMIMEMALKNKRSLGAETLRSIAPSIAKSVGKGKSSTAGGIGLGVGRSWGWGPPWW
ncbi:hypothetical protein BGZ60DRAFT_417725 [Tricladium varicosporioides]|nr:hypothetical protein BGZ60DRAFT_417725 [Hymenoscyphus varicosporioides]